MKKWFLLGLALALGAAPAFAQAPEALSAGDRIRATYRVEGYPASPTTEVTGTYGDLTPERLRLTVGSQDPRSQDVPLDRLIRLEVRSERSGARSAGRGAIYGTLAGAVLGLVLVGAMCTDDFFAPCGAGEFLTGPLVVGGMGAGVGALVGLAMGSEEWREVPLDARGR